MAGHLATLPRTSRPFCSSPSSPAIPLASYLFAVPSRSPNRPSFFSSRSASRSTPSLFFPARTRTRSLTSSSSRLSSITSRSRTLSTMVAEDYASVLRRKYPGKLHAKRTLEQIREKASDANGVLYLEGRHTKLQEDNDSPEHFRQRRYFYYLTGCNLPDCRYVYDIHSDKSILFIPPIDPDDVIWSGLPMSIDDALSAYDVDEVKLTSEINAVLAHLCSANPKSTVYAIENQVSDDVTFIEFENKDYAALKPAIERARVVKDEYEVAMIRKANHISGLAHKAVIERVKTASNEQQLYATFLEKCVANGAPEMAYHPILAAGRAAATLHYVANDATLSGKQNLLLDAGCEWDNYASDITRTFPLNGKFTKESRAIYDIVHKMQSETTAILKEGIDWDDAHLLAHKIAIDGLLSLGILKGDKDEILKARTSAAFFPHGLGHYIGMDTHDVGGNPNPKDPDTLFRYLRLRAKLPAGSVVTNEPGIYFCEFIIRPYLKDPVHSKYIDADVLDKYWDVGGVRIEDNILITKDGYENLTDAIKEASEVEAIFAAA